MGNANDNQYYVGNQVVINATTSSLDLQTQNTNRISIANNGNITIYSTATLATTTISTSSITNLNVLATLWANVLNVLGFTATNATITNATTTNIFANYINVSSSTQASTTPLLSLRNADGLTNFYIASGSPAGITPVATGSIAIDSINGKLYIASGTATTS
jgi:hypothetical protein